MVGRAIAEADKGETLGQADARAVLRETAPAIDWFYLSPAASALRRGLLKVLGSLEVPPGHREAEGSQGTGIVQDRGT